MIRQVTDGPHINHPTYFLQSSFFPGGREMRFLRDELLAWLASLPGEDQSSTTGRTQHTDPVGT